MTNQGYRMQTLTVSNFRGITEQRTIDVSRRHLFLLGPNAFGKSTIVEAIRWCLFGSPSGQQEIEVRNTFCPAETCDVVLDLAAQHRTLAIHRSLPPGRTESRTIITDHEGRNLLGRDAFPQLARLGQPTGTQVIFAAQHAAGRRQAEISDFSTCQNNTAPGSNGRSRKALWGLGTELPPNSSRGPKSSRTVRGFWNE
jgi:DNA repair exonuclease SbcCD ATPase subunit